MAGQKGRSGRPRKPIADLLRSGTFRVDRHGARPVDVGPMPTGPARDWRPSPEALAGLGPSGKALVAALTRVSRFTVPDGELVVQAAHAADAVEAWRARAAEDGPQQQGASRLAATWARDFRGPPGASHARVCPIGRPRRRGRRRRVYRVPAIAAAPDRPHAMTTARLLGVYYSDAGDHDLSRRCDARVRRHGETCGKSRIEARRNRVRGIRTANLP